ncbi:hypothetical protein ACFQZ4_50900 [Catellatospora coxensis]
MVAESDVCPEKRRLAQADSGELPWRAWGPYLSERAWGTVREDYSATGEAWTYFPHDHARSRTYRWNEDGMAGICDDGQHFCFALALWNGQDPILKERMFGLTGPEGNHGEDVKEYWWYEDSTPTHSHMSWRYHYPQAAFPYSELVEVNARRGRHEPEFELLDTGVFADDRYWSVTADYAKASPTDLCVVVTVANRGPDPATLHVLPTLWFRNTWAWGGPATTTSPRSPARAGTSPPSTPNWARSSWSATARRPPCSATTRPTRGGCGTCRAARRTRRTASTTTSSTARPRSTRR